MQRILVIVGVLAVLAGLLWPWIAKLPFGRLPGDIVVDRPGFRLFLPLTTSILVSVLVSVVFWLFRR